MDPLAIPVRAATVRWQVVHEEALLMETRTGVQYSLNAVGLFIWQCMDGDTTCREIVHEIVDEFDVDGDTAWSDLLVFLDAMMKEDLVLLDTTRTRSRRLRSSEP